MQCEEVFFFLLRLHRQQRTKPLPLFLLFQRLLNLSKRNPEQVLFYTGAFFLFFPKVLHFHLFLFSLYAVTLFFFFLLFLFPNFLIYSFFLKGRVLSFLRFYAFFFKSRFFMFHLFFFVYVCVCLVCYSYLCLCEIAKCVSLFPFSFVLLFFIYLLLFNELSIVTLPFCFYSIITPSFPFSLSVKNSCLDKKLLSAFFFPPSFKLFFFLSSKLVIAEGKAS